MNTNSSIIQDVFKVIMEKEASNMEFIPKVINFKSDKNVHNLYAKAVSLGVKASILEDNTIAIIKDTSGVITIYTTGKLSINRSEKDRPLLKDEAIRDLDLRGLDLSNIGNMNCLLVDVGISRVYLGELDNVEQSDSAFYKSEIHNIIIDSITENTNLTGLCNGADVDYIKIGNIGSVDPYKLVKQMIDTEEHSYEMKITNGQLEVYID